MVDFGSTLFDQNLGSAVPIVEPVRDKSSEYFAQGLKSGIDGLNGFLAADAKNKSDQAKGALYQDITEKISLLADARDQGKMTLAQSNMQLRVWSNEWVSEAPSEAEAIFTHVNKLTQERAIGGSVYTETPQETVERKLIEDGGAKGWDVSTPTGVNEYKAFLANANTSAALATRLQDMKNNNEIASESFKAQFVQSFQATASGAFPWVQSNIKLASQALQSESDPVRRQAIIDDLKFKVTTQLGVLSSLGANAGAEKLDYLITPINNLMTQFESVASGKTTTEALTNSIANTKAQFEALTFLDPVNGKLFIMNAVSPFTSSSQIATLDKAQMEILARMNTKVTRNEDGTISLDGKPPDLLLPPEQVAPALESDRLVVEKLLKETDLTPEVTQAMNDKMAVNLQSVTRNGKGEEDATNFNAVVGFYADTSVGRWMEANYQAVGPKVAQGAKDVVERQYSSVVIKLVNDRWTEANDEMSQMYNHIKAVGDQLGGKFGTKTDKVTEFMQPEWNGYGLEFKVNDEFKDDPGVVAMVKDLNQGPNSVTGPINKLIRMSAHLSGRTDYEAVYKEEYANRLWQHGDLTSNVTPDANETLPALTNIPAAALKGPIERVPPPADLQYLPSSAKGQVGALLDGIGEAEGATYNTLFGYAEQPGKAFAGTDVTDMTLGEVAALQKLMVKNNGISSAVGKYQFIQDTLKMAIKGLGLKEDTKFTPEVQDKLAIWLLQNTTNFNDWIMGNGDSAKFQNGLAAQWASIPNTSGRSHYAGDGVNGASEAGKKLIGML